MTDVTRYICFIIGPDVHRSCTPEDNSRCPPTHQRSDGTIVHRNDTKHFPYECYLQWCPPPNLPGVKGSCDPYSNPAPQELMQILPCAEWAEHGFPATAEEAWVGTARTWDLNVGALGAQVYFAGKNPGGGADGFTREWISFEIGPEMMYQPSTDASLYANLGSLAMGRSSTSLIYSLLYSLQQQEFLQIFLQQLVSLQLQEYLE